MKQKTIADNQENVFFRVQDPKGNTWCLSFDEVYEIFKSRLLVDGCNFDEQEKVENALAEYKKASLCQRRQTDNDCKTIAIDNKLESFGVAEDRREAYNDILALTGRTFSDRRIADREYAEVLIQNSNVILNALQQPEPDLLIEKEYSADDVLKILCSMIARMMEATNADHTDITKTIYGSGLKFTINVKADQWGAEI